MKTSLAVFFALMLTGLLVAQDEQANPETMENADMSDGSTHWHGDCKPAGADMTTDFTSNSGNAKGIIIDLHSSSWTKVTQEIHEYKGRTGGMLLTIVYQAPPDITFSTFPNDYGNLGPIAGFGGANVPTHMGQATAFIDMPPASRASSSINGNQNIITIYSDKVSSISFAPKTDGERQTVAVAMNPPMGTHDDNPTFCLAFPPGHGSVTILKISLVPGPMPSQMPGQMQPGAVISPNRPVQQIQQ